MEDVAEDDVINVLAEEVEEEPVPDGRLLHDNLHALGLHAAVPQLEEVGAQGGRNAEGHPTVHKIGTLVNQKECTGVQKILRSDCNIRVDFVLHEKGLFHLRN